MYGKTAAAITSCVWGVLFFDLITENLAANRRREKQKKCNVSALCRVNDYCIGDINNDA
jgi:hypothetical protein